MWDICILNNFWKDCERSVYNRIAGKIVRDLYIVESLERLWELCILYHLWMDLLNILSLTKLVSCRIKICMDSGRKQIILIELIKNMISCVWINVLNFICLCLACMGKSTSVSESTVRFSNHIQKDEKTNSNNKKKLNYF